jgi:DNA processing protein
VARSLARDLVGRGAAVFSGLARGIDAEAHRGALEGGGVTVAVLGTGLDVVYPRENRRLADEIVERGGAVVTEMPLGSGPFPRHFPLRNRIISGLSWGVTVVEAGEKSGSLITARLGMEQGREVFAVPGNITSPTSEGSNALIAGGAKLVRGAGDVVDELPPPVRAVLEARAVDAAATAAGDGAAGGANGRDGDADKAKGSRLEGKTAALYGALSVDSPVGIDELAARLKMPAHELHPHLFQLELSGRARPLPGGRYVRTE